MLAGQPPGQLEHPRRLVGDQRHRLRVGCLVDLLGDVGDRLRAADQAALRVGDLVGGDAVHERLEGHPTVGIGGQRGEDRHAHLLGHVLRGVLCSEPSQPDPCVAQGQLADPAQERLGRDLAAGLCVGHQATPRGCRSRRVHRGGPRRRYDRSAG